MRWGQGLVWSCFWLTSLTFGLNASIQIFSHFTMLKVSIERFLTSRSASFSPLSHTPQRPPITAHCFAEICRQSQFHTVLIKTDMHRIAFLELRQGTLKHTVSQRCRNYRVRYHINRWHSQWLSFPSPTRKFPSQIQKGKQFPPPLPVPFPQSCSHFPCISLSGPLT